MSNVAARPTLLEIDLDAAAHNVRAVRQLVGPERKIFAVIKAGGYGFGAAEMGTAFARNGADWLAVADLSEGIRLRQHGISTPILVYPNSCRAPRPRRWPTIWFPPSSISTRPGPTRRRRAARATSSSRSTSG